MPRRILLADADAFYVSVARLMDPEGAGKSPLLIVGGSPTGRGVVTSASYEARAYGVHSAMPMARAARLCPQAMIVPVSFQACGMKSREIREVLGRYAPVVEQASQDEFYLDMSGTERLYKEEPLDATAARMREVVLAETKLSVSIGGGASRVVAKMAAGVAKPGGVHIVAAGGEEAFMRRFALAEIPYVGKRFEERLARYNLKKVDDAFAAGLDNLRTWLGDAKSISRDETFATDIDDDGYLKAELIRLVDRAAGDLRDDELLARTVTVRLRDYDFKDRQASKTLASPILSDQAILRVARELLIRLRAARSVPARLLGVGLGSLVREDDAGPAQLSLLDAPAPAAESEKDRAVARVVDKLRHKLGDDAIALGRKPTRRRR
jgi:DNA polymerase-4